MNVDRRYLPAFLDALAALEHAAANLDFTLQRVRPLMPLTASTVATLAAEDRERLDALAARFARCQQMAGVAFKALALAEAEPQARFIDLLALMQKRGLIDSIEAWDTQRDLRNEAGHTYLVTDIDLVAFHNTLADLAPAVSAYATRLRAYATALGVTVRL